ncbi:MAG: cytochrome b N-terminal domain-containing protein [Thermodesulfobacteriota bacterium]
MNFVFAWFKERFPSIVEMTRFHATEYPTPANLNYFWGFGILIMVFLMLQVVTGIGVAMFYKPDTAIAFDSIERFRRHVHWGWLIQSIHAVCPTFIFAAIYMHMGRGIYYGSYKSPREIVWWIGLFLLLAMMMESFMGYVLPWGQMSYWAGTVITGLASVIPVFGDSLVTWVRGDIFLSDATLSRFYSLHIALFPLAIIGGLIVLHTMALHDVGSNNPVGVAPLKEKKLPFYPYYVAKDCYIVGLFLTAFMFIIFFYPNLFLEADNFNMANPSLTPPEIKPEWYFLPFFAMLRSIPSKGLGVLVLWGSMWILFFLPFIDRSKIMSGRYRPVKSWLDAVFFCNFLFLAYLGARPPFGWHILAARIGVLIYFGYFVLLFVVSRREKKPDELLMYERSPERITMHESSGTSKRVYLVLLVIALGGLNIWAFNFNFPSREMVAGGKAVYEAKGKTFHDVRYIGERATLSAADRKEMLGVVPPDLSLKYKSMSDKTTREFLSQFIGKTLAGSKMVVVFTEEEVDQLEAFLEYASEPGLYWRARIGPWVILFMSVFTVLLYILYKEVWLAKERSMRGG